MAQTCLDPRIGLADYVFSYFLPLRDPILVQILSLGEVGMHPAERPGDGEEPRSHWECAGNAPGRGNPPFP